LSKPRYRAIFDWQIKESNVHDHAISKPEPAAQTVTLGTLFLAFSKIGLCGFGGVAAWAHRVLVDERHWYDDKQYADLLSLGSILPGPNVVNISIMVGDQLRGPRGSLAAISGLLAGPLLVLIALATIYERYGQIPVVEAAIAGVTAAAAGLVIGTVLKMARRLRQTPATVIVTGLVFIAAAILHWHLLVIMALMIPLSLALTTWERRR
jgi:chromate transporter